MEDKDTQSRSSSFLSQGQGDRFDRWVEFFGALVLSAATVATAWCAYQAALWSGDESKFYFEASAAQVETTRLENKALQRELETLKEAVYVLQDRATTPRKKVQIRKTAAKKTATKKATAKRG